MYALKKSPPIKKLGCAAQRSDAVLQGVCCLLLMLFKRFFLSHESWLHENTPSTIFGKPDGVFLGSKDQVLCQAWKSCVVRHHGNKSHVGMLASLTNMFWVSTIGQDQRESIAQSMKDTVDEMISAFDRHLEDSAAYAKQQFRWMKRRYREKIDVNRAASRIELKVWGPLGTHDRQCEKRTTFQVPKDSYHMYFE